MAGTPDFLPEPGVPPATASERGAALLGLTALAVAQPVFEVVSNGPEFFAARNTTWVTGVAAVAAICVGIPLLLLLAERGLRVAGGRMAAVFHGAIVAALAAALVMPWVKRVGVTGAPWDVLLPAVMGVAIAVAFARLRVVRLFLTALSLAALVVPAAFLLNGGVRGALQRMSAAGAGYAMERTPPIVLVVFDELPLNSLLDDRGGIDARRYPNFAALAGTSWWFRDARTVSSETVWAVPAILSGRYPTIPFAVPTLRYYPHNLFTILADRYEMFLFGQFPKLCPEGACRYDPGVPVDSVPALLADLGVVWLHVVLPERFVARLPTVAGRWGGFAAAAHEPKGTAGVERRAAEFGAFLSSIDGAPARLHVLHSLLPHMPFEYVPSGRRYRGPDYQTRKEGGKALFERASASYADTIHQRHLAQVGYVDRLVGDLLARLREVGADDSALLIVTADHGASHREGHPRRAATRRNVSDILRVPLFVKLPGQREGRIVDDIVETVDILPTILDVLAVRVPVKLDGRSLIDTDPPSRTTGTFVFRGRKNVEPGPVGDLAAQSAASLRRKIGRFGSGDPLALHAVPGTRRLLGTPAAVAAPSGRRVALREVSRFDAVDLRRDPLPLYVRGTMTPPGDHPVTIAVLVNGVIAATTESYREGEATVFGTLIPEDCLREGRNTVEAVVIDRGPSRGSPSHTRGESGVRRSGPLARGGLRR